MKLRDKIKELVRESLLREKGANDKSNPNQDKSKGSTDKREANTKRDYSDIQNALNKDKNPTAPSHVGVMKSMGIEDDEAGVNRSLFGKKVHQERNSEGGLYQFDEKEAAIIRGIVGLA